MRRIAIPLVAAFALGVLSAAALWYRAGSERAASGPVHPVWAEVAWPFLMDEWGEGKAFRCAPADCGSDVTLYLRAKVGFCNCTTGVSDDEELTRVGDLALLGRESGAAAPGHAVETAAMRGRSRAHTIADARGVTHTALAMAFNQRCDAVVATVLADRGEATRFEAAALALLDSDAVRRWTAQTLGL